MEESDLEQVLSWRNHPEIRRNMFTQNEITSEEHALWFSHAKKDQQRHLLIFTVDDRPRGFINMFEISCGRIGQWGFYVEPDSPRGTGSALGESTLQYAFKELELHKICSQALGYNDRSIQFHLKLGFQCEGILRQQHFDGQNYEDVVNFGLLASEWHQKD